MSAKNVLALMATTVGLLAPASAQASMFADLFNKAMAGIKEQMESSFEWMMLNSPSYLVWKSVTLPSGACGDGSPYRIFVNQSPGANKTVVFFEPGGACWDMDTCMGIGGLSAFNPNGIPRNYLASLNLGTALGSVAAPMINRIGLDSATPTRGLDWNYVYMPYCTGDVHAGNNVRVYRKNPADPASPSRTQYFKGHINSLVASNWLASQKTHLYLAALAKPDHLLMTGQSAGGFGTVYNYSWFRTRLNPNRSGMFSDSGWVANIPSPRTSDSQYRGVALKALDHWNVAGEGGLLTRYENDFQRRLPDRENVGDMPLALSAQFPQDRFIYATFVADETLPGFANQALGGPSWPAAQLLAAHETAIQEQIVRYDALPNVGYFVPFGRDMLYSHVLTAVTFDGTRVISTTGPRHDSVNAAILSALNRTPEPIRAVDASRELQKTLVGAIQRIVQ